MRQTLSSLREQMLAWLDDPRGENFAPGGDFTAVDRFINRAYQAIVDHVDLCAQAWNFPIEADGTTVTTDASTREYAIAHARMILEVKELRDDGRQGPAIEIVPFHRRDDTDFGVYVFRRGATADWYVGLVRMPPVWARLRVFGLPALAALRDGNSAPIQVPADFHEIVALEAAVQAKVEENREAGELAALLSRDMARMTRKLSNLHGRHSGTRY